MSRGRVCFHVPYLYPLLSGKAAYAGGLEVQQMHLARGLAGAGFEVSVVSCDYGQPARERIGPIEVHASFPPFTGLPVVRFLHPRLTRTVAALRAADADAYLMQGSGLLAGITCDVAHAMRRPFAFLAAHDHDTLRSMPFQERARERWWYRRALRHADLLMSQTDWQRDSFRREWGLESEVVRNPVPLPARLVDPAAGRTVLWLATYKPSKRPEWFTALARRLPQHRFVMCGVIPEPPLTRECYDDALAAAKACPNLEVRGFVRHDEIGALFADAALLVHTSPAEGFPNVFLEAWSHGLPTVTAYDPDGVIRANGIGEVADSVESFERAVAALMAEPERRAATGRRARAFVEREHAPAAITARLGGLLEPLVARGRVRRRS